MEPVEDLLSSTETLVDRMRELRDGTPRGRELSAALPELAALVADGASVTWEHPDSPTPLFDHSVERALARKLAGVESRSLARFQTDATLSSEAFERLVQRFEPLRGTAFVLAIRAALLFCDFAKGGTAQQRAAWERAGTDLSVHNQAASEVLERDGALDRIAAFDEGIWVELVLQLVLHHGLAGQIVRGETPPAALDSWGEWVERSAAALVGATGMSSAEVVSKAVSALHVVDVCDTAAVREGLMSDRLFEDLEAIRDGVHAAVRGAPNPPPASPTSRLRKLRAVAHSRGASPDEVDRFWSALPADEAPRIEATLARANLWYFEPATWALSTESALRLLIAGLVHAEQHPEVDTAGHFHVTFEPLVGSLGAPTAAARYRARLVDALLRKSPTGATLEGTMPGDLLATFFPRIGGSTAVAVELRTSQEAEALVTLLSVYEQRSSVAFHQILKLLCDAYDLRKDEFDRVANEAEYLAAMNSARSDKERLLDFVVEGTVVEIGPGGGVVLDLLEQRYPASDIIGVDSSTLVADELRRRKNAEGRTWRVVHGDAFQLEEVFGAESLDTVIFCSVLHEIYSYVERDGRKFQIDSVAAMLRTAYRALRPGGRILIRDGIRPAPGRRRLHFLDPDGPDFLRRFADEFEGRRITVDWLPDGRAEMSTPDAMEFLYCYTWGPASFPYEVRELYGIMERDEYDRRVLDWLSDEELPAASVAIPSDLRSYLQPGYPANLGEKVEVTDDADRPTPLPDSNAVMVYEKPRR